MTNMKKLRITFFIVFPIFLFCQLAYGLVVREPYPSFIMPGFSKIDTKNDSYILNDKLIFINNNDEAVNLKEIAKPFSKIAISKAIHITYFSELGVKNYNSSQKKYYNIVKNIIGNKLYNNLVEDTRNPKMTSTQKLEFNNWIIERIETYEKVKITSLEIKDVQIHKEITSGKTIEIKTLNSVTL